ncbi:MAG TPA: YfiR family protein [Nevskiaceae bacterium]|nr:YfiR family protein [Nevskiaceae bacterium]
MGSSAVIRRCAALLLSATTAVGAQDAGGGDAELERRVKAAFVFNFVKFVTWPPARAPAPGQPYVLCVVDADAFARTMSGTVRDKRVEGRPLVVKEIQAGATMAECHVAYLGPRDAAATQAVLDAAGQGVLTVHEADAPVPDGVVRFFLQDRRVRFEVNVPAAARRQLELSSRLLSVAERVETEDRP